MNTFHLAVLPIPDMVFHPHTMAPIYIVEPSYIEMIKSCVEKRVALGVIIANPTTESTICTLAAATILEELPNGELSVLLQGIGRCKLEKLVQHIPWPVFEASPFEDRPEGQIFDHSQMERLSRILNSWLYKHIDDKAELDHFLLTIRSIHHTIDYIAMLILKDMEIRELLLSSDSLNDRIRILNLLLKDKNPFEEDADVLKVLKKFEGLQKSSSIVN